jgi:hypothetical protein
VVRGAYPSGTGVLLRQGEDGVFRDVSAGGGASGRKSGISAAAGDFDGDGRLDLFAANWGENALYANRGAPGRVRFEDVARAAGLSEGGRSWSAVFSDVNGDGRPDLLVARGGAGKAEAQKLYLNRGDGTFADRTAGSGLAGVGWSMAIVTADFDGDGDFDVFIASYDGRDRLYRNDGGAFTDVTGEAGVTSGRTVGAAAGDIDGDLLPDLVTAGFDGPVRVWRNRGAFRFAEVGERAGIGPWKRNEGVVLADADGDGDLDLYVANYDGRNRLYRNTLDDDRFLKVIVEGGGRPLEGAVARLYRAGGQGEPGSLLASREISGGSGFCTQPPPEFLFRLPDRGPYDLRVTLPGGRQVGRKNVPAGRLVLRAEEAH